MRHQNLDWNKIQLAKKFHLEGLSPAEVKLFLHWKATDSDFARAVEAIASNRSIKEDLALLESIDEDVAWTRFSLKNFPIASKSKIRSFTSWYRAAAVFAGVLLCASVWWMEFSNRNADLQVSLPAGSFSNKVGSVSSFLLPDSTRVWLSTGSALQYGADFPKNRKVLLQGEAFFEVRKNPDFPFEVTTGGVETEVLGTSFNLKAYPGEGVDLSVFTGKVQFGEPDSTGGAFLLTKNQTISWSAQSGFSEIKSFDSALGPDWKSSVFRFENASLEDIVQSLGRWYPVEFEVAGQAGRCRFSGEFHRSSLEQILEVLSYTLNLSYQIHETTVKIKSKPC
ncbi:FecR family protein [Algoriphagus terrigena]|uniref:FecR family protein n=1 Tax=Algoriphagus terrigena TaxID=344884 RepID=UPI00047B7EB6|nr:FecR domain-containing protein [Algoriphagus terrigena]